MRWSKTSRHVMMSIIRMQSSSITTPNVVRLDESKTANKANEPNNIVAAAFASLKDIDIAKSKNSSFHIINNKIDNATTVEELLSICNMGYITKQHALKVNIML